MHISVSRLVATTWEPLICSGQKSAEVRTRIEWKEDYDKEQQKSGHPLNGKKTMTKKVINAIKPGLVVLVTAGASGIGSFISKAFLDHGCHVHICDIDKKAISRFLTENPTASASVTDVSNRQMVETLFADVMKRYSRLDVLVNNAGVSGPTAAFDTIKPEVWAHTLAVNLRRR